MAIYHFHAQIIGRSSGHSAVAAAAYRSGETLEDDRQQEVYDYTRKSDVLHTEILAPDHAPDWVFDRQTLWNEVEAAEKRKDSQLARDIEISCPAASPCL